MPGRLNTYVVNYDVKLNRGRFLGEQMVPNTKEWLSNAVQTHTIFCIVHWESNVRCHLADSRKKFVTIEASWALDHKDPNEREEVLVVR